MARRVRRPAEKEDLLKSLTEEQEPFSTMAAAMIFAAALGYASNRRTEFDKSGEQIPWEVFANAGAEPFIDMIAAVASDEKEILANDRADDRVQIFEEYANGGLEIIRDRLAGSNRAPLDMLLDLALEFERTEEPHGRIDLEAIAADLSA